MDRIDLMQIICATVNADRSAIAGAVVLRQYFAQAFDVLFVIVQVHSNPDPPLTQSNDDL
jgi:hypothetical protein